MKKRAAGDSTCRRFLLFIKDKLQFTGLSVFERCILIHR